MRVSVQRKGTFSLNAAAFEGLGKPEAVILFFDKETQAIGLKPADRSIRHAYPIRKQGASQSYLFGAQSFLQHCGLSAPSTRTFDPEMEDGILVFEWSKGVDTFSTAGRKKRAEQEQKK